MAGDCAAVVGAAPLSIMATTPTTTIRDEITAARPAAAITVGELTPVPD
ncbi:hypothetical protein [Gordonia sihwensis]|nr:hypothetical protein [Gordonia sihwensis]WFN92392.1 hypothetical protein P5P27_16710 [Gordonia sihwensis]